MADKFGPQSIEQARMKYEAGFAIEAARILMGYSKELSARNEESYTANEETLRMSDQIAEIGIRLLYIGDCPARQEFARTFEIWKREREGHERKGERLAEIVQMYLHLFTRLVEIVDESVHSFEWLRRMERKNIFEAMAHGHDHGLSDQDAREYFLNRVCNDIDTLFAYAHSFNSQICNHFFRRGIRHGLKHEYLDILLALESSCDQLQELKSLQTDLRDAPEYLLQEPTIPVMLGAEWELLVDLRKLGEQDIEVLCH